MTRTTRQQRLFLLSIAFACAPPAFALIAALSRRHDLRMLWMAIASFASVAAVMSVGQAPQRRPRGLFGLSLTALVVGMSLAAWTAMRLGASAAAGILAVAFVLTVCWVTSFVLRTLARAE